MPYSKTHTITSLRSHLGFSLVELLVVIAIMAVLTTAGYFAMNLITGGDFYTSRIKAELETTSYALTQYLKNEEKLPNPVQRVNYFTRGGRYSHSASGAYIVQGFITDGVIPTNYQQFLPRDARTNNYYVYSKTLDNKYFQIAGVIFENNQKKSYVIGNYPKNMPLISIIPEYNGPEFVENGSLEHFPYNPDVFAISATIRNISVLNQAKITRGSETIDAAEGFEVFSGDVLETRDSRLTLYFSDGTVSIVEPNSKMTFTDLALDDNGDSRIHLNLNMGEIWMKASTILSGNTGITVDTANAATAVRGTIFGIFTDNNFTNITLNEGKIDVSYGSETKTLNVNYGENPIAVKISNNSQTTGEIREFHDETQVLKSLRPGVFKVTRVTRDGKQTTTLKIRSRWLKEYAMDGFYVYFTPKNAYTHDYRPMNKEKREAGNIRIDQSLIAWGDVNDSSISGVGKVQPNDDGEIAVHVLLPEDLASPEMHGVSGSENALSLDGELWVSAYKTYEDGVHETGRSVQFGLYVKDKSFSIDLDELNGETEWDKPRGCGNGIVETEFNGTGEVCEAGMGDYEENEICGPDCKSRVCKEGFTRDLQENCVAVKKDAICKKKPENSEWNRIGTVAVSSGGTFSQYFQKETGLYLPSPDGCTWKCNTDFHESGSGGSVACVLDHRLVCPAGSTKVLENSVEVCKKTVDCVGTLPENSEWNPSTIEQTSFDGNIWSPSPDSCVSKCKAGFHTNNNACVSNTVEKTCISSIAKGNISKDPNADWSLPAHIDKNSGIFTAAWDGFDYEPLENKCDWSCRDTYHLENNICVSNTAQKTCTVSSAKGNKDINADWSSPAGIDSNGNFSAVWNSSEYTPSTSACDWTCKSTHHLENNTCVSNTVSENCNLSSKAPKDTNGIWTLPSTVNGSTGFYTSAWNGTAYDPSLDVNAVCEWNCTGALNKKHFNTEYNQNFCIDPNLSFDLDFDKNNANAFYAAGGSLSPFENTGNIFENGAVKVNGKLAYPAYGNIDGSVGTVEIIVNGAELNNAAGKMLFFLSSGNNIMRMYLRKSVNNDDLFFFLRGDDYSPIRNITLSSISLLDQNYVIRASWKKAELKMKLEILDTSDHVLYQAIITNTPATPIFSEDFPIVGTDQKVYIGSHPTSATQSYAAKDIDGVHIYKVFK